MLEASAVAVEVYSHMEEEVDSAIIEVEVDSQAEEDDCWQSPPPQLFSAGLEAQSPLLQPSSIIGGLAPQSPLEQLLLLSTPAGGPAGGAVGEAPPVRVIGVPLGAATPGSLIEESRLTAGKAETRERREERARRVV